MCPARDHTSHIVNKKANKKYVILIFLMILIYSSQLSAFWVYSYQISMRTMNSFYGMACFLWQRLALEVS